MAPRLPQTPHAGLMGILAQNRSAPKAYGRYLPGTQPNVQRDTFSRLAGNFIRNQGVGADLRALNPLHRQGAEQLMAMFLGGRNMGFGGREYFPANLHEASDMAQRVSHASAAAGRGRIIAQEPYQVHQAATMGGMTHPGFDWTYRPLGDTNPAGETHGASLIQDAAGPLYRHYDYGTGHAAPAGPRELSQAEIVAKIFNNNPFGDQAGLTNELLHRMGYTLRNRNG